MADETTSGPGDPTDASGRVPAPWPGAESRPTNGPGQWGPGQWGPAPGEPGQWGPAPGEPGQWGAAPGWPAGAGGWQGPPPQGWYGGGPGWQPGPWSPYGPAGQPGPHGWGPLAGAHRWHPPRPPRTPEERRRRNRFALLLTVVLLVAVGVGIGIGAWIAPSSPSTVANGLVSHAVTAAEQAGAFHYVEVSTTDGTYTKFVGDAGRDGGRQEVSTTGKSGVNTFALRLVKGTLYFEGNTAAVVDQLGVPATTASSVAGHWVKLTKGDAPYKTLAAGITASSNISQLSRTFVALSSSSVAGSTPAETRISGDMKLTGHVIPGTASLLIASSSSLPQRLSGSYTDGTVQIELRWEFSKYREKVSVTAPKSSEPYSSLGASSTKG